MSHFLAPGGAPPAAAGGATKGRPELSRRRLGLPRTPRRGIPRSMDTRAFDYVIVGAGSAGCVLADRLSADGRHSVAVLEAGGSDRSIFIQMPAALQIHKIGRAQGRERGW